VWNIPDDAKAYLLDLLQGGGVSLHINYIDLLYRTLHDVAESPRAAFRRRNRLILKLLEKYKNQDFGSYRLDVVWSPVLPRDLARLVASEQTLVQNGIHSKRRAMSEIGIKDPDKEFAGWLEEREAILRMNQQLNTRTSRGGTRERVNQPQTEDI
jgi:hypothetical protein